MGLLVLLFLVAVFCLFPHPTPRWLSIATGAVCYANAAVVHIGGIVVAAASVVYPTVLLLPSTSPKWELFVAAGTVYPTVLLLPSKSPKWELFVAAGTVYPTVLPRPTPTPLWELFVASGGFHASSLIMTFVCR